MQLLIKAASEALSVIEMLEKVINNQITRCGEPHMCILFFGGSDCVRVNVRGGVSVSVYVCWSVQVRESACVYVSL